MSRWDEAGGKRIGGILEEWEGCVIHPPRPPPPKLRTGERFRERRMLWANLRWAWRWEGV